LAGYNISFAGAGRVAGALCEAMYNAGLRICKIVSLTEKNGKDLAARCEAKWSSDLVFSEETDIIIVSVPDKHLEDVLREIRCRSDAVIAHTAGSYGLEVFPSSIRNSGVLYPLQTFSMGRKVVFKKLPFIIESSGEWSLNILKSLAEKIEGRVYITDAEHRKLLHLSAVFVCNFTNHMLHAGKVITKRAGFPFEVLEPLIHETILKAEENGPEKSQTGPAARHDLSTVRKHLELLSFSPRLQNVYREVSESIMSFSKSVEE